MVDMVGITTNTTLSTVTQTNSIVPLCPHADTTERLVRSLLSIVPLCPQMISIVPLCPYADTTERLVRPVVSAVPLCPQRISIVLCVHMRTRGPFHKSSYERFLLYEFVEPVLKYGSNEFVALTNLCETGRHIMEIPLCPVMFMLGWSRFLQQYSIIYTYIGTIFNSLYVSWK